MTLDIAHVPVALLAGGMATRASPFGVLQADSCRPRDWSAEEAAFLEVADHYFSEGNYEAAAANYLSAADDLGDLR